MKLEGGFMTNLNLQSEYGSYLTLGGVRIHQTTESLSLTEAVDPIIDSLDSHRGVLFGSFFEFPGRYTQWDIGFIDPPIEIMSQDRFFRISALNERGEVILPTIASRIADIADIADIETGRKVLSGYLRAPSQRFPEEQRSKQSSIFSILRAVINLFYHSDAFPLGLYGAFSYDLAFQFEPIDFQNERPPDGRDLVLYLPDQLVVVNHPRQSAVKYTYDFESSGVSTQGIPRCGVTKSYVGKTKIEKTRDLPPGGYSHLVRLAHKYFERGDLFEVVPSQCFFEPCSRPPSQIYKSLSKQNPSPYAFLMNLGQDEYLIGASPEMYVRVEGDRVESCPISGTIARGRDAISDADQILQLLNSKKDASELTMCTDVDRNDKSRVCVPGSVRVIGRRQIEMYSRVIHTVDHVEGTLREGFDAIDAFLTHTWAVTVTGAPKLWAMRFIEEHESLPRSWYGGAVGCLGFNGNLNSGLTIRSIRVKDGTAEARAGSTLLIDSDPEAEEKETELKVTALIDAIRGSQSTLRVDSPKVSDGSGEEKKILLIDHEDSFVHTLANYLRQAGAKVLTVRAGFSQEQLVEQIRVYNPNLLFLSPGPGVPRDFNVSTTIATALDFNLPIFGVCLGLQGIVEFFGGELGTLPYPMHGKESHIQVIGGCIFMDFPEVFTAGRYHSLYAIKEKMPPELLITAESNDGVIMAIEHHSLPLAGVQFHPESIMSLKDGLGEKLIQNIVNYLLN